MTRGTAFYLTFVLGLSAGIQGRAFAGGLARSPQSLMKISDATGLALLVKPHAHKNAKLTATVQACFSGKQGRCTVGRRQSFDLFQLPRLDPREWVMITRYWNACDVCVTAGRPSLILIEAMGYYEPLEDNPRNRRLAALVGHVDWTKRYARATALPQLRKDLGDPDLFRLAYRELSRRGKLSNKALIAAARRIEKPPRAESFNLLLHHLKTLKGTPRSRFIDQLVGAVQRGERHGRVLQALNRVLVDLKPSDLGRATKLASALSFKVRAERPLLTRMFFCVGRIISNKAKAAAHRKQLDAFCRVVMARQVLAHHNIADHCRRLRRSTGK